MVKSWWGGGSLVLLGLGLFVANVSQDLLTMPGPFDVFQSAYSGAAALFVATAGGYLVYDGWPASEQRRVLGWTLAGGGFLCLLAFLGVTDLQSDGILLPDSAFVFLHLTTFGCLGGAIAGLYHVRSRRSIDRASTEHARYERLVERIPLPVAVVDTDGSVLGWNGAAEETFGYEADEVLGRPTPLVPPQHEGECGEYIERLVEGETVDGVRTKRRRSDGTLLDVELWATALPDPESDEQVAVFVARDLTQVNLLEQERTVLERVLRHNIRNELSIIRGYANTLSTDRPAGEDELGHIRAAADRLISLSDHVGRLQRLDDEITSRNVTACVTTIADRIRAKYPEVNLSVDASVEAHVQAVPLLHDAVHEAIENAIVHTAESNPDVSVRISTEDESDYVRISIADPGPAIPDTEWQPIVQGSEKPLEHESGLGLWVMYWAAACSGGKLTKQDRDPDGNVVTFLLPKTTEPNRLREAV